MDVPPIARAAPEHLASPPPSGPAPDTSRRLANIEAGLADLGERLDALAETLEASLRVAVAEEVRLASGELRHTVSELGRLLVRDLGRLSKILAEHRDSILADLRAPAPAPAPRSPSPAPVPGAGEVSPPPPAADRDPARAGEAAEGAGPDDDDGGGDGNGGGDAQPDGGDSGERQRRTLLRRRQA